MTVHSPISVSVWDGLLTIPEFNPLEFEMKKIASMLVCGLVVAGIANNGSAQECQKSVNATHVVSTVVHQEKVAAKDIVDTAVGSESFSTLVAAVKAAGLVDVLKGNGPFTVFAPTNEAFAKLPKETLESLLKPENKDKLAAILTYHVVAGKVMAADVVKLSKAKTVQGQEVKIKVVDGKVMLDNANVTKTDIVCKNGVIHVIDTVILPASK